MLFLCKLFEDLIIITFRKVDNFQIDNFVKNDSKNISVKILKLVGIYSWDSWELFIKSLLFRKETATSLFPYVCNCLLGIWIHALFGIKHEKHHRWFFLFKININKTCKMFKMFNPSPVRGGPHRKMAIIPKNNYLKGPKLCDFSYISKWCLKKRRHLIVFNLIWMVNWS